MAVARHHFYYFHGLIVVIESPFLATEAGNKAITERTLTTSRPFKKSATFTDGHNFGLNHQGH
jgi:hypothetical protein